MKTIFLRRISMSDYGTFGALVCNEIAICVTLELPYNGNQKNISSIPSGHYLCLRDYEGKYKHFKVLDVPDREAIEFHEGNTIDDLRGCIALGLRYGELNNKPAVLLSRDAFKLFHRLMRDDDKFALIIEDRYL